MLALLFLPLIRHYCGLAKWECKVLGQKRFVLAAKTGLCWQAHHPPATLSQ
jgi:hypothetical protein